MSAIRELYQQVILDHNKSPRNYHAMPDATRAADGYNPLCGDHYKVYVRIQNGIITDISFEGAGCAISKASASVMSSMVKGKTIKEAESLFAEFHRLVTGTSAGDDDILRLGKLAAFAGVSEYPARVKCASLAWHTMHAALSSDQASVSTE
jgi:nitrogen fixation NifU-like protein